MGHPQSPHADRRDRRKILLVCHLGVASCALVLAYFVGVEWQPELPILGKIPVTGYEPGWLEAAFGRETGNLGHHVGKRRNLVVPFDHRLHRAEVTDGEEINTA